MQNQDAIYMNFDNLAITKLVIEAMHETGVKRIIQAGVLSVYGEVGRTFCHLE
ncbi:NAD-dependent epimerase/dehydratase family protein [Latilactobacillus sakei]